MHSLSHNEKLALYGLIRFPLLKDREIAEIVGLKVTTFSSIKERLKTAGYYRTIQIPMLERLGAEILCVIYTHFNPAVPAAERARKTSKTIEISDELFYSAGETSRGFSLSLSKDYTDISKIEEKRIDTFAQMGLLEEEYPTKLVFPFETSQLHRFLDYAPLLKSTFEIELDEKHEPDVSGSTEKIELSQTERTVFCALIENPELNDHALGEMLPVSRHTIATVRKKFVSDCLIKTMRIPSMKLLGFNVLSLYHLRYNPSNPPDPEELADEIMDDSTIFFISRKFESFMLAVYPTFQSCKDENVRKIQFLKTQDYMTDKTLIEDYSIRNMITIKDMVFGPIARKIVRCDLPA